MDDRPYYYRVRGRLFGPLYLKQIRHLVQQAQIGRSTDVSRDNAQWAKACDFPELFVAGVLRSPPPIGDPSAVGTSGRFIETDQTAAPSHRWFYTINENQQGPVDLSTLQQLVANGSVSARDYVIREGDTEWVSATKVPSLTGMPFLTVNTNGGRTSRQRGSGPKGGKGMAVASMVLGILGLAGWLLPIVGLPITMTGLGLGIPARRHGMGIAGIALSAIGLVLTVINASIGAYMGAMGATASVTASKYEFAILDGAIALDGKQARLPVSYGTLVQMIGDPDRSKKLENTIHTWDHLGLLAYQAPGSPSISEVRFCFKPESFAFSPRSPFDSLVMSGVTLTASSTKNDVVAAGFQQGDYFLTARLGRTLAICTFNDVAVPGVKEEGLVSISCSKAN